MIPFERDPPRWPGRGSPRGRGRKDRGREPRRSRRRRERGGRLGALLREGARAAEVAGGTSAAFERGSARTIEIPDPSPRGSARGGRPPRRGSRAAWLLPPLVLGAIIAGFALVPRGPLGLSASETAFGLAFGAVLLLLLAWILVSALTPAKVDRTCPRCARKDLRRSRPDALHGLECRSCGWSDEGASAFLHLEEEGPFEDIVLRERRRRRSQGSS